MPVAYVKQLAKSHGVSVDKAEERWAAAKQSATKQGRSDDYAYITGIFKKMMHEVTVEVTGEHMTSFSQIRTEQAVDVLNQAKMRGLEVYVIKESKDWTTLQFTSHHGKISFDEMARGMGVTIHGDSASVQIMDAINAVSEGMSPKQAFKQLIESSYGITRGMANAYGRGGFKYICANEQCGVSIPQYRGKYPSSCPSCGSGLMTAEQWERRKANRSESINEFDKGPSRVYDIIGVTYDKGSQIEHGSAKILKIMSDNSVQVQLTKPLGKYSGGASVWARYDSDQDEYIVVG